MAVCATGLQDDHGRGARKLECRKAVARHIGRTAPVRCRAVQPPVAIQVASQDRTQVARSRSIGHHQIDGGPLVAVHKAMIGYYAVDQRRRFLMDAHVVAMIRPGNGRLYGRAAEDSRGSTCQ